MDLSTNDSDGPGLFALDPPRLVGGRCENCGEVFFPFAHLCPLCRGTHTAVIDLSTSGTIYSYTVVRVPVPGYAGPVPYGLGLVDLPDGIRVTTMLLAPTVDDLEVGAPVDFAVVDLGDDDPFLSYAYEMGSR